MTNAQYINRDETVFNDAKSLMQLNKNILLKGPTGSGKTKLAETLSETLNRPMHQINCSVDLDTESLLGFKTIQTNENGSPGNCLYRRTCHTSYERRKYSLYR